MNCIFGKNECSGELNELLWIITGFLISAWRYYVSKTARTSVLCNELRIRSKAYILHNKISTAPPLKYILIILLKIWFDLFIVLLYYKTCGNNSSITVTLLQGNNCGNKCFDTYFQMPSLFLIWKTVLVFLLLLFFLILPAWPRHWVSRYSWLIFHKIFSLKLHSDAKSKEKKRKQSPYFHVPWMLCTLLQYRCKILPFLFQSTLHLPCAHLAKVNSYTRWKITENQP